MGALERGKIVAGRYRLERALAQGGMGCVWVARHLQLDTDVAIKFMTAQLATSADACARFEREARASAALRLANAVQIHDYGVEDGAPFLVMELLEGEDLHTRLRREGRLGLPVTLGILVQVGRALRRAHEVGIVHRDLKPANIFMARQGGEEVVKLLDFGIAKDTQSVFGGNVGGVTGTGALLGSPHYMSPEQVRSTSRVDHRTDLWALGVIVFRCLTGSLPFPGEEIGEVLVDVCIKPIPLASALAPDLGLTFDPFFARALSRDPAARFQSVDELLDALGALSSPTTGAQPAPLPRSLAVAAVTAPPEGTLSPSAHTRNEPARKSSRSRSVTIAVGAIIGASVMGALLAFALFSSQGNGRSASTGPTGVSSAVPVAEASRPALPPAEPPAPPVVARAPQPTASAPSALPSSAPSARPPVRSAPANKPPGPASKSDDLLNHI